MTDSKGLVLAVEKYLLNGDCAGQNIVAAVSGGADSMALARSLLRLQSTVPLGTIIVAHFNHQLRGEESDGDDEFVQRSFAKQAASGVRLRVRSTRANIRALAMKERQNLESAARQARYSWLAAVAKEEGAAFVATGHSANDQAETILHRLMRGTGLNGLRGIPPRRRLSADVEVIRPVLAVGRRDIIAYLAQEEQAFREDSSNANFAYTRNRIRRQLLPVLENIARRDMAEVLTQLASQVAVTYDFVQRKAKRVLRAAELARAADLLVFQRDVLSGFPRFLVREAFRLVWLREGWPERDMGFLEWESLAAVALGETQAVDLPGGIRARARQRVVQIGKRA